MIPLMLGYCETHFRFGRISPSLLFRREPEILADCPARLAPGCDLPIMILFNEINEYPAEFLSLKLTILAGNRSVKTVTFDNPALFEKDHPLKFRTRCWLFSVSRSELANGWNTVHSEIRISVRGKQRTVQNDNFPTASHAPFSVFVSDTPFPAVGEVLFGDFHCHSLHTNDHVEFGAPLEIFPVMGTASGLNFAAVTDHSYDLECLPENYRIRDNSLSNWKLQQRTLPPYENFTLLVGEEISGRKKSGGVVHLGALGHRSFVRGSGDGARLGYRRDSEPTLQEAADMVLSEKGITFAAHPGERASLLQRVLLRRGNWTQAELSDSITAFQGINGGFGPFWYTARKLWVNALLAGKRIPLAAGNDAHGDFNRYRAIGFPFLSVAENMNRYFGLARTILFTHDSSPKSILETVRRGATAITDGPCLTILREESSAVGMICSPETSLIAAAESSEEFGSITSLLVITGKIGQREERTWIMPVRPGAYSVRCEIDRSALAGCSYVRAELETEPGLRRFAGKAVTSPVWLEEGEL